MTLTLNIAYSDNILSLNLMCHGSGSTDVPKVKSIGINPGRLGDRNNLDFGVGVVGSP